MASVIESNSQTVPKEDLRQAFELFNEMSQQLTSSYANLESQVQVLSGELAAMSAARMKELKEKERVVERMHSLLQLLPGGVVVLDGNGCIQEANRAASALFAKQDLIGKRWRDIISDQFSPQEDDGHEVSMKNGRRLSIQTSGLENEPGQIVLMTDQTQTRELQAKLARHQRLTEMGKMVASLAHQVRTPLAGAFLYCQHLANPDIENEIRQNFSKKLSRQLKNIEAQVRDMLIFAKGSAPLDSVISVDELLDLINESKHILQKQFSASIEISNQAKPVFIQCHQQSLIGAIQNLMANGLEAAEDAAHSIHLTVTVYESNKHLCIAICDNGPGLPEQLKNKLIEPFYTTKSNGTGLGLPVVNAVVRAHHGQLTFHNQVQGGACFIINLPIKKMMNKQESINE